MSRFAVVTEQEHREKLLEMKKSPHVIEGMELIDVMIADLEREKSARTKNTRRPGRMSLREKLWNLTSAVILSQKPSFEKD